MCGRSCGVTSGRPVSTVWPPSVIVARGSRNSQRRAGARRGPIRRCLSDHWIETVADLASPRIAAVSFAPPVSCFVPRARERTFLTSLVCLCFRQWQAARQSCRAVKPQTHQDPAGSRGTTRGYVIRSELRGSWEFSLFNDRPQRSRRHPSTRGAAHAAVFCRPGDRMASRGRFRNGLRATSLVPMALACLLPARRRPSAFADPLPAGTFRTKTEAKQPEPVPLTALATAEAGDVVPSWEVWIRDSALRSS